MILNNIFRFTNKTIDVIAKTSAKYPSIARVRKATPQLLKKPVKATLREYYDVQNIYFKGRNLAIQQGKNKTLTELKTLYHHKKAIPTIMGATGYSVSCVVAPIFPAMIPGALSYVLGKAVNPILHPLLKKTVALYKLIAKKH